MIKFYPDHFEDAILCQFIRDGKINIDKVTELRKDVRKIRYSKEQDEVITMDELEGFSEDLIDAVKLILRR